MRVPSSANQLTKLGAQVAAGNAAALRPSATAAQAAQNESALQARPSKLSVQERLQPPRQQQIGKLLGQLLKPPTGGGLQPRPQIQSASTMFVHGGPHAAPEGHPAAPMKPGARPSAAALQAAINPAVLHKLQEAAIALLSGSSGLQPRPQIQTSSQILGHGGLPSHHAFPQGPVHVPPHDPAPPTPSPAQHDGAASFASLLPGGPSLPPVAHTPTQHSAPSALFASLLPGGPPFAPAAPAFTQGQVPGSPIAQIVHQAVHTDPQSFASVQTPAVAAPVQSAAPAAAAQGLQRLEVRPPPATAKFQQTVGMLAHYDGEHQAGNKVWPTKVTYLDEQQRQEYKLTVRDGKIYDAKGELFDTAAAATVLGGGKAIFVMDHDGNMFASTSHAVGKFHHSSFLAGQPVAAAGEIEVHNGEIVSLNRKSGHYRPSEAQLNQVAQNLTSLGLSDFQIDQKV